MGHRPGRLPWTQNSNRRRIRTCQVLSVKQSCDLSQTEVAIPLSRPLSSGQLVELILDENPSRSERCRVVWVGKAGSKLGGVGQPVPGPKAGELEPVPDRTRGARWRTVPHASPLYH